MFCQNILRIDSGELTDTDGHECQGGRMVIHTARYGEEKGECDLLMHRRECKSVELAPVTRIPLALGSADASLAQRARPSPYLRDLQHLGVESVQVEHELGQADEGQLDGEHLPEGPVVRGVGEGVQGPLLQHAARHHVALHLLQDVPQDLGGHRGRW